MFTIVSSLSHGRKRIYGFQGIQCLLMAVASIFFGSLSGLTTFLLCALRNAIIAYDRYTKRIFILFLILIPALGLFSNNRGALGLLPVITTIIYTVGQYYLKSDFRIKSNIALNLLLWAIYDFLVLDIVSGVVDAVSTIVTVGAIFRDRHIKH
ncbi:MAG: YgjV family protein [Lachnospiraceae bacterium]|nr:YgjV family protein [Candidatus Equihabitans merdae]